MTGFYNPAVLLLLLILPAAYYLYQKATTRRKHDAMCFSHIGLVKTALGGNKTSNRPQNLFILVLVAMALIIIGLAGPHIPLEQAKEGVSVVLAIDTSGSMQATDYLPNRLESAKQAADILLSHLDNKDYAGVITFESGATSAAYLSPDKNRVRSKLAAIAPKEGSTAIGDGLALAIDMALAIPNQKRVIILLSDGVNNAGVISPDTALSFARDQGIQVFTVGMGSENPVILGYDWFGRPQVAELDEEMLKDIATKTGGKYYRSVNDATLKEIYGTLHQEIVRETEDTPVSEWFFAGALIVLCLELLLRYGRKRIIQ